MTRWPTKVRRALGRIGVRLLIVNLVVLLVPVAGLEFARLYERQLLGALERDMRHQAVLVRRMLEVAGASGGPVDESFHQEVLVRAAVDTRARVRVILRDGDVMLDSHRDGPPEGLEPGVPSLLGESGGLADRSSVDALASEAEQAGKFDAAFAEVDKRLALDPKNDDALADRARVQLAMKDTAKAIKTLKQAIAINPKLYYQVLRNDNFKALWDNAAYKALGDYSRFHPLAPSVSGPNSMPMPPIPK